MQNNQTPNKKDTLTNLNIFTLSLLCVTVCVPLAFSLIIPFLGAILSPAILVVLAIIIPTTLVLVSLSDYFKSFTLAIIAAVLTSIPLIGFIAFLLIL